MNNFKVLEHSGLRQWFVPREDRDTPIKLTGRTAIETEAPTQKQELRYAIVFPDGKGGHLSQEERQRRAEIKLKEEAARLQAAEEAIKKEEEQKPLVPCASSPQNEQTNESYSLKEIINAASQSLEEMETSDRNVILREMYPVASPSNYSQTQGWMLQQPPFSPAPASA